MLKLSNGVRAISKGVLKTGAIAVPVKCYTAVQETDVHFHALQNR